jgi:hypothetical protein
VYIELLLGNCYCIIAYLNVFFMAVVLHDAVFNIAISPVLVKGVGFIVSRLLSS